MKNFLSSRLGIILSGGIIGIIAVTLQKLGNPPNMGICAACFERDIAGALGLHRVEIIQYIRPEIAGLVLGAFIISIFKNEYQPRGGSSTVVRFFLGMFAMIGALVFLGCSWRALLRIAGGDWNGITGLLGLIVGVAIGVIFFKNGYTLGRSNKLKKSSGWVFPAFMVMLLIMLALKFKVSETGPVFMSANGPGSQHAPLLISLGAGLIIGILAQRSRFCTIGSIRDIILVRDFHLAKGVLAFLIAAAVFNIIYGQFKPGFYDQPIAHPVHVMNFLGMVLAGLAFTLAGACPGRQLILAGEGDSDAAIFVMGMIFGAGISHNFLIASSGAGPGTFGLSGVIIGLVFCLIVGFTMRDKIA
ncbi:MAG: YedE family putative selenium transporter [Leptospirales bacterium]|nr:YedE family putative selenium transporter [Leptospirales bacterium]